MCCSRGQRAICSSRRAGFVFSEYVTAGQVQRVGELAGRARSRLVWRALTWRAGSSAMFLVVAIAAVMAATAGPVYLRAADQSILSRILASEPAVHTGLTLSPLASSSYVPPATLTSAAKRVPGGSGRARSSFGPSILTIDAGASLENPSAGRPDSIDFVSRTGVCAELRFSSGHCAKGPDEVALSVRTAKAIGVRTGSVVHPLAPNGALAPFTVSGLFVPVNPSAPYWWSQSYFPFGTTGTNGTEALDDAFVTVSGAARLVSVDVPITDWVQLPLRTSRVAATRVPAFERAVQSYLASLGSPAGLEGTTALATVLTRAEAEEHTAGTIVAIVSLQLVLLGLIVLYGVARATSARRAPDVAVAELRGLPRRRVVMLALREPVLLLAAAVPIGIGLTALVLAVVDGAVIGPTGPTAIDSLAVGAALAAGIGGMAAAALGSRALLSGRSGEESQQSARQRRQRNAAILDALGVALALAGVVELVGQHGSHGSTGSVGPVGPVAYLGPGLLALGAGVVAARLLPLAARRLARRYDWSPAVGRLLASRAVARREGVARRVLVPAIATGLLVFALTGLVVAARNHEMQARFTIGAPVVLDVTTAPGTDLVSAVRAADPSGRKALAAVKISASNGTTLAVDSSRLAAVASWPRNLSGVPIARLERLLHPKLPRERIIAAGSSLALEVTSTSQVRPPPDLQLSVFDKAAATEEVLDFGNLRSGTHTYRVPIGGICTRSCRLDEFSVNWAGSLDIPTGASATELARLAREIRLAHHVTIRLGRMWSISGGHTTPVRTLFGVPADWRGDTTAALAPHRAGLTVVANLASSAGGPTFSPVVLPPAIPGIATSEMATADAVPGNPRFLDTLGLDGSQINGRSVAVVPALPAVGNNADLVDLSLLEREQTGPLAGSTEQVWVDGTPERGLLSRLAREGVHVTSTHRAATVLSALDRTGPALGFDLFGLAAAAAALLALGALVFAIVSDARERRIELACLAAVGVPKRTLLRSLVIESTVVSLSGALVGSAAAIVSAALALGFLPEFPAGRVGPPLELSIPYLAAAATGAAMFVLLELATVVASYLLVARVRPDLVRLAR